MIADEDPVPHEPERQRYEQRLLTPPLPSVGEVLSLRMPGSMFPPTARAIVCWTQAEGPLGRAVGLRVVVEGRGGRAWLELVEQASQAGRPSA